jgi:hypothetical protein
VASDLKLHHHSPSRAFNSHVANVRDIYTSHFAPTDQLKSDGDRDGKPVLNLRSQRRLLGRKLAVVR